MAGFNFGGAAAAAPAGGGGGFAFGGTPAAAPAAGGGGFSFGGTPAAAPSGGSAPVAPAGGFAFGASAPAPAADASKVAPDPAPAAGGLFGGASASTTSNAPAPAPSTTGGFSFGGAATADAPKTAGGGISFGGAPTAPTTNATDKAAPAPAAGGGFSFGGAAATNDATKESATATPAPKTAGLAFGGATTPGPTPAAKAPSPVKTPATPAGGGLFGSTPAASTATPSTTTTTPAAQSTTTTAATDKPKMIEPPPIEYQSLTIEQILNRFQSELETDAIAFLNEAQRVSHYDGTLRDTQSSLSELTNMVSRSMLHQSEVDTQLQGIGSYQNELSNTLDLLEQNVDELFAAQSNMNVEDADIEREKSYERAIEVDGNLDRMNVVLTNVVNDLNAAQERVWSSSSSSAGQEGKDSEEVGKIIGVFNAHHETLAYLEGKVRDVEADMAMISQVLAKSGQ